VASTPRSPESGHPSVADRVPAPALFLASGLTQYCGAALAIGLFAVIPAASVAWWRLAVSAIVLLAWRRPWRQSWTRRELAAAGLFGAVLATMNVVFYVAIEYLPLGTAVAIEFLGPVAVAAATGRGWRDRVGIALAAVGVVLLAGVQLEGGLTSDVVIGLAAILGSAAAWAGYILLGRRLAVKRDGISALAVGMTAGALLYSPLAIGAVGPIVTDAALMAAVVGIAVLSSVIPYALEQVVLRRVSAARFAILLALLPVTATLIGVVLLSQLPTVVEVLGMGLICGAIVLSAQRRPAAPAPPVQDGPIPPIPT
jgi:inner membrane transporter RhtA